MSVCATCLQPGLPADGRHDCPGLGDIQLTRQLGRGIRVDTAPARARMALTVFADHGHGLAMQGADMVSIADQVLYQVVGYDAESAALVLELVEDWRPNGTKVSGFVPFARPEHIARGEASADPLVVEPYRNDRNQDRWAFRCWGTATCEGWVSLDHTSQQWAEHARDRHVAEEHTKEQPMPADKPACTATINGPHVLGGGPVQCTREAGHPENHVGRARGGDGKVLWSDHHAGAVPHGAPAEGATS